MKTIEVVPYDSKWPAIYEAIASKIKSVLGDNLIEIHHIGSTSVPGLAAKPVIDVIALVNAFEITIPLFESIGFESRGEMYLPFRQYFRQGKEVNLHVYEKASPEVLLNLCFRDYLLGHEAARNEYQGLKYSLLEDERVALKDHGNFTNYNLGKDEFIRKTLKCAGFDEFRLMYCNHHHEWANYHRIRKEQLFDPYQTKYNTQYNPNPPAMTDPNCFHFVMYKGLEIVSVAMIEFLVDNSVILRSLATDEPYKMKGYGREMMLLLEKWVKNKGKKVIKTHSALPAEQFYHKLGYIPMKFDDRSILIESVDLGKEL